MDLLQDKRTEPRESEEEGQRGFSKARVCACRARDAPPAKTLLLTGAKVVVVPEPIPWTADSSLWRFNVQAPGERFVSMRPSLLLWLESSVSRGQHRRA